MESSCAKEHKEIARIYQDMRLLETFMQLSQNINYTEIIR